MRALKKMKKPPFCSVLQLYFLSYMAFLFIWQLLLISCERYIVMFFHSQYKLQLFTLSTSISTEPWEGFVCLGTPCLT